MSKSPTITDANGAGAPADWLHNPHAGEILALDFMEPLSLSVGDLANRIVVDHEALDGVVSGRNRLNAELDLRLARYFGMSAGFFLRLQVEYEILEARRALADALDRIVPRAA